MKIDNKRAKSMKIVHHDSIDSTTLAAQRLMDEGKIKLPFAVTASSQTAGRGRQGRDWVSFEGNLYVTMVFATFGGEPAAITKIPLYVAVLMARWIAAKFALRVTVKWPNDLLFAGRKIGGILCSSHLTSDNKGACVSVGIGLNINHYPDLNDDNRALSIAEILKHQELFSQKTLAKELVKYFDEHWQITNIDETLSDFADYAVEDGQLWIKDNDRGQMRVQSSILPNGNLSLAQLTPPYDEEAIFSVQHDYRWIYQGEGHERYPLVVADLGNSRFKVTLYETAGHLHSPTVSVSGFYSLSDLARLSEVRARLDALGFVGDWPLHFGSVNRAMESALIEKCAELRLRAVSIPKRPVRVVCSDYATEQMGIDRLALMEGVLTACPTLPLPIICISAGTAITIDLIDHDGHHCGGVILPGLAMRLFALGQGGSLLPKIPLDEAWQIMAAYKERPAKPGFSRPSLLGINTKEAIVIGSLLEINGAVCHLKSSIKASPAVREAISVVVSGGDGQLFASHLVGNVQYLSDAVLLGLRTMVLGGMV